MSVAFSCERAHEIQECKDDRRCVRLLQWRCSRKHGPRASQRCVASNRLDFVSAHLLAKRRVRYANKDKHSGGYQEFLGGLSQARIDCLHSEQRFINHSQLHSAERKSTVELHASIGQDAECLARV
jgi:hypothetical protein